MSSVASFFISRIDTLVDQTINERLKTTTDASQKSILEGLLGKVAVANARLTYQLYKQIIKEPNWLALVKEGAMTQRLLWGSTGTNMGSVNYRAREGSYPKTAVKQRIAA